MSDWILDLFSGLGGASEAFVKHPSWRVVRIENNPELAHVEHTRLLDVTNWIDWLPPLIDEMGRAPTIIWASPECKWFSLGFHSPRSTAQRNGDDYHPDMSQLQAIFDIIEYCKDEYGMPRYWIVENVNGSEGYFIPYVGKVKQRINSVLMYGHFPNLHMPKGFKYTKKDSWSTDPMRYNIRSKIPIEISTALLDAVHSQTTLSEWI